jgi:hypothetical protein
VTGLGPATPDALYAIFTLRKAQSLSGWRSRGQRCEPPEVLGDGSENKLVLGASRASQSKPTKPQDALKVCEPHLDLLALAPRLLEALGASERSGDVSAVFMDVARNLACRLLWAALRFERTYISVELACVIWKCLALVARCRSSRAAFRPGNDRRQQSDHIESRCVRRSHHLASICRRRGCVARCPSPRPASSASKPHRIS